EYAVADGILTVSSPAVGDLSGALDEVVDGAGGTLEDVIGEEGLVNDLAGVGVNDLNVLGLAELNVGGDDTTVSVEVRDALNSVVENVVNEALEDEAGIVSIDLANGDIQIDLAKIVKGGDASDLNGLDPNTQVLTSDTISQITDAVADAVFALSGKVNATLTEALSHVHLVIELPDTIELLAGTLPGINCKSTANATLGQLTGTDDTDPDIDTDLAIHAVD